MTNEGIKRNPSAEAGVNCGLFGLEPLPTIIEPSLPDMAIRGQLIRNENTSRKPDLSVPSEEVFRKIDQSLGLLMAVDSETGDTRSYQDMGDGFAIHNLVPGSTKHGEQLVSFHDQNNEVMLLFVPRLSESMTISLVASFNEKFGSMKCFGEGLSEDVAVFGWGKRAVAADMVNRDIQEKAMSYVDQKVNRE